MINDAKTITALSVDPGADHQIALAEILPEAKLYFCAGRDGSLTALRKHRIAVVLCDSEADWRGLLEHLKEIPDPPFLIVTSRLADDRLWSEALNLGAYDVLAKPFDSAEVTRVLTMACMRWAERSRPFRFRRCQQVTQPAFA